MNDVMNDAKQASKLGAHSQVVEHLPYSRSVGGSKLNCRVKQVFVYWYKLFGFNVLAPDRLIRPWFEAG